MALIKGLSIAKLKKKESESDVQRGILDGLESLYGTAFDRINNVPVFNQRTQSYQKPNRYARKGTADIIGCLKSRFIAIEVKTEEEYNWVLKFMIRVGDVRVYQPKNKKEEHAVEQIIYLDSKSAHGGLCFFTYSLEHVLKKLKQEGL